MKTIYLNADTIEKTFEQLKTNIGGAILKESNEYTLEIRNKFGQGTIQGVVLSGGISYIEFDLKFYDDIAISINTPRKNPIYFAYCYQGSLTHSFGIDGKKTELQSFQTGIISSKPKEENVLYFKKNERLNITLITVQTSRSSKKPISNDLKTKLYNTFIKDERLENFVYVGSQNLKIAEKIQQIHAIRQKGLVRTLLIQGLVNVILALEIQQHADDEKNRNRHLGILTTSEMKIIKQVSEYIEENFDRPLSISFLCSQFGITALKLQEGFKLMHGRTVSTHIKWVRVQKAEEYLKHTDMNISEIVYSIGFSSRSYFSKIFKESFNCSPREYKEAQKVLPISA
ncbi:AraC family transcriptional regulator [Tamlana crocina]